VPVGSADGEDVGDLDGAEETGDLVGLRVVGPFDGEDVGDVEGIFDGAPEGSEVAGDLDGPLEG